MKRSHATGLLAVLLIGLVIGFLLEIAFAASGAPIVVPPVTLPLTLILLAAVVVCGGASLLWLLLDQTWAMWVGIVVLVISIINLVLEPRRVRAIGYLLRNDDLLFRRGILFQRFVAVPYGRMQLIDITRGPVARWLGLADLKFVTAAATAGVSIPGLAEGDAEDLRDRLVELAESRRAGL